MKYILDRGNYHQFEIMEVNKLPARSYFIPFETRQQADSVNIRSKRYSSAKVQCLNGTWDFCFYPHPADFPGVLDTDKTVFSSIDVPSCWQFRGYDRPFYINTRYQFPFKHCFHCIPLILMLHFHFNLVQNILKFFLRFFFLTHVI